MVMLLLTGWHTFADFLGEVRQRPAHERAAVVRSYLLGRGTPIIEQDSLLTFVWFGRADSAMVNGDLQDGWRSPARMTKIPCGNEARAPALFYRTYVVPPDARIEYKFVIDGVYTLDSTNHRATLPGDFVNSEAGMPAFRASMIPAYRPSVAHGHVDTLAFPIAGTPIRPRRILVYVPPGYNHLAELPSVYVHDGESVLQYGYMANSIDNLIADGALPPIIAVFVPPVEREEEYAGRKLPEFIDAICDQLVPLIDTTYRTACEPGKRGVMGISSGGHVALMAAILRPETFACAAGQSSQITPALRVALSLRQHCTPLPSTTRFWLDWGTYDIVDRDYNLPSQNRELRDELTRQGIPHRGGEVHEGHNWANWRDRMPDILRYFFLR